MHFSTTNPYLILYLGIALSLLGIYFLYRATTGDTTFPGFQALSAPSWFLFVIGLVLQGPLVLSLMLLSRLGHI